MNDSTINGHAYTDPSTAIKHALDANKFNEIVAGKGRVQVTIEAEFNDKWARIYGMEIMGVAPAPAPPPAPTNPAKTSAVDILRGLAAATGAPGPRYIMAATHDQMTTLDEYGAAIGDHAPENVSSIVSQALLVNRTGKPVDNCGLNTPDYAIHAVKVLVDLLEAP